jgi:hypothetical protein
MFGGHFYHQTIRRAVSVFGTIFNDINIVRRDGSGNVLNIVKVPLAYGPRQKFLARIEEQALLNDPTVAIKLPRMSFEITSLSYDPNVKMAKGMKSKFVDPDNPTANKTILGPVGYRMGMQLSILAKNQDDALQILEQILPHFQPQYTVTVKQVEDNYLSDMPITLQGVSMADDYEGDYATRRALVYTLDFETKVRFYGDIVEHGVIKNAFTNFFNNQEEDNVKFLERQDIIVSPQVENADQDHTQTVKYVGLVPETITLTLSTVTGFNANDNVVGLSSSTAGAISEIDGNDVTIVLADGLFEVGETLSIQGGNTTATISAQIENWV